MGGIEIKEQELETLIIKAIKEAKWHFSKNNNFTVNALMEVMQRESDLDFIAIEFDVMRMVGSKILVQKEENGKRVFSVNPKHRIWYNYFHPWDLHENIQKRKKKIIDRIERKAAEENLTIVQAKNKHLKDWERGFIS